MCHLMDLHLLEDMITLSTLWSQIKMMVSISMGILHNMAQALDKI